MIQVGFISATMGVMPGLSVEVGEEFQLVLPFSSDYPNHVWGIFNQLDLIEVVDTEIYDPHNRLAGEPVIDRDIDAEPVYVMTLKANAPGSEAFKICFYDQSEPGWPVLDYMTIVTTITPSESDIKTFQIRLGWPHLVGIAGLGFLALRRLWG